MPRLSPEWAKCIEDILKKYGMNYREARLKGGLLYSHTTIREWAVYGTVPVYSDDLPRFLEMISSRGEAEMCLRAAGLPLPTE